jgi:PP-loop superfamily ATP-utilizing enzyme
MRIDEGIEHKYDDLRRSIGVMGKVAVTFSGGWTAPFCSRSASTFWEA